METTKKNPAAPATDQNPLIGLYRACGTVGNVGTPGAPIMHYSLLVDAPTGRITGMVNITQAIKGPSSNIRVAVTGQIRGLGFGTATKLVTLSGEYTQYFTPPAIGQVQAHFSAHMAVNNEWDGRGGFEYGVPEQRVEDVPVKHQNC